MASTEEKVYATSNDGPTKKRRKRTRWGDASSATASNDTTTATETAATPSTGAAATDDAKAKALALQDSIRQRLAALKQQQQQKPATADVATSKKRPLSTATAADSTTTDQQQKPPAAKKAKHYELDLSITGPTFRQPPAAEASKPKVNPYLAHRSQSEQEKDEQEEFTDGRLSTRAVKPRKHYKPIHFVEPGTFTEIAERKRQKAANAAQSGFSSGRKAGKYVHSAGMESVYGSSGDALVDEALLPPRADADPSTTMPQVMEWWDVELLPGKLKKQVASAEGKALSKQSQAQLQQLSSSRMKDDGEKEETSSESAAVSNELQTLCFQQAALSYSKTAELIQHLVPIRTGPQGPAPQPTLHLTKRERKRQRKLRRTEKQRELQDMQAAGLIPPPEPRLTLKNFIQVLGQQAFVDPSQMEQKVVEQMQKRQRAHLERNAANKLTKEQKRDKLKKKLHEDTSEGVTVALFWVKDMSHPYHRTKVDLNAQQNNITGGVLECEHPSLSCVICEGGPKAIKRYTRLMTVRMKWTGPDDALGESDEEEEEVVGEDGEVAVKHKFNPDNKCELIWTGMGAKRLFKGFVFQSCETSIMARKVLAAKGVAHFWDRVLTHASGKGESFHLKLAADDDKEDKGKDDDVKMESSN